MPGEDVGSHPTLMGLITKDRWGNDEIGFAKVIDMDYKDKGDQWTDIMIHVWDMEKKDFKALCEKLRIGWVDDGLADPNVDYEND